MTEEMKEQMDWDNAETVEGKPHGVVISVRLDPTEAENLRTLASDLHLNMSQVMRRALAAFDPTKQSVRAGTAFGPLTFGGAGWTGSVSVSLAGEGAEPYSRPESTTIDTRVRERVTS
jgi:hypothetical protein